MPAGRVSRCTDRFVWLVRMVFVTLVEVVPQAQGNRLVPEAPLLWGMLTGPGAFLGMPELRPCARIQLKTALCHTHALGEVLDKYQLVNTTSQIPIVRSLLCCKTYFLIKLIDVFLIFLLTRKKTYHRVELGSSCSFPPMTTMTLRTNSYSRV